MDTTVAVIGGGAAGMAAAIAAAREGGRVTLYERNDRLGKKILSTGNGRCNLGNRQLSVNDYCGGRPELVESCLRRFGTEETVRFFQGLGLLVKDKNGYLYPASEQASSVLDVLRAEVGLLGVRVCCSSKAVSVERSGGRLAVTVEQCGISDGMKASGADAGAQTAAPPGTRSRGEYDRVILACGGQAAPKTGSDGAGYALARRLGHTFVPTVPALVQLKCREEYCRSVAGVRADAGIHIFEGGGAADGRELAFERGELQLTEYGISGIPVFQLSGKVNYRLRECRELTAVIDFLPDFSEEEYRALIRQRALLLSGRTVEEFFTGLLHKKLMTLFIKLAGLKAGAWAEAVPEEALWRVYRQCRAFTLHVTGNKGFDNAQVSAGGVDLRDLTEELESVHAPGVYFAGELLDVDGRCGGYNLQWAWCSGYLAGQAAVRPEPAWR